jgi:hypothetical protein
MKTISSNLKLVILAISAASLVATTTRADFSDGFEGPTLDPFWLTQTNHGYVNFPSTVRAHTGHQSVELGTLTTTSAYGKTAALYHNFPGPTRGTLSVWVYDTGADILSSNYILLCAYHAGALVAYMGTTDYDRGPPANGSTYFYSAVGGAPIVIDISQIDRTQAWHEFTIASVWNYLTLAVDGTNIYTAWGDHPFDQVVLEVTASSTRPPWAAQFDDFSFQEAPPPPTCNAGGPYIAECGGACTTVQLDGSRSTDTNGSPLTFWWTSDCPGAVFDNPASPMPRLIFNSADLTDACKVTLIVSNAAGAWSPGDATVTVQDTLPPEIGTVVATPAVIWPPNHKMVDVYVGYSVADRCDPAWSVSSALSVVCNEPASGLEDGSQSPDWQIIDPHHVRLRADRSAHGAGRVYTIQVTCADSSGHTSTKAVVVPVPKSQGR